MTMHFNDRPVNQAVEAQRSKWRWMGVVIGLAYPTLATWCYFILAAPYASSVQQAAYTAVKSMQFAFPLIWVWAVLREPIAWRRPKPRGIALGAAFSLIVVALGLVVYAALFRESEAFAGAAMKIRGAIDRFSLSAEWQYAVLAGFYSLLHSFLEEYYWRWFVFGQLRRLVPRWPAIGVSAAAFAAHHVVVLSDYFGDWPWGAVLLSVAVAAGGAFWAWLYERTGSLVGPWVSHLIIDAGVFWIGYDLLWNAAGQ
jgi:membrane protease YdiL (CAAX protease family)